MVILGWDAWVVIYLIPVKKMSSERFSDSIRHRNSIFGGIFDPTNRIQYASRPFSLPFWCLLASHLSLQRSITHYCTYKIGWGNISIHLLRFTLRHFADVERAKEISKAYLISTWPRVPVLFPSMYSSVFDNWIFMYESTLISWPWYSVWPHLRRIITGSLTLGGTNLSIHELGFLQIAHGARLFSKELQ